ncbi:putative oxygen-independent coproporphyrinogen III oxidase [Belliella baltica DSM 15883]|uniref:Heme chaperone HemW n=1 Tax=Belliella baltica (strain DSM 15883 / CIP 108006 / LMG 21964 / BA134) TaxID=866536 RepID=I3Z260_BELBD|nr:radical SAM family heme chaperone HemW [Belliella baltica]AFL83328.1 putative oxygen-independent coproporphyrinogen III oxidase [Belliella baltica DSM 15883]
MAGIYIHIPFCKQACHYCDFHFSTNLSQTQEVVDAITLEIVKRKEYLPKNSIINTIYFGGGTPSLLSTQQLEQILETISKHFILDLEELTIETNPDDLKKEKLKELRSIGIDRLSIGIQSFDARLLKYYNRAHNAEESLQAIDLAKNAGFEKLSIDLIYGFPSEDHQLWEKDLAIAIQQDPGHISSYCLTVEPKTALGNWAEKGKFKPASEDFAADQFEMLQESMEKANYIQYEISNFGKINQFAIHNKNYWQNTPYLGVGPSAHSYDGKERGFNISNNIKYIKAIETEQIPFTVEAMTEEDIVNEYILTSLRTIWGTDINFLNKRLGNGYLKGKADLLSQLQREQLLEIKDDHLILSNKGKLLADSIAASLFI